MTLTLHNYFRSSTSTRLRAALNLKGLDYDYVSYALKTAEHRSPGFLKKNPQGLVPALELEDGTVLSQSLAIIEWLEETCPEPALLPADPVDRARVRALGYAIACEVHPVNNLRILKYLVGPLGHSQDEVKTWFQHWVLTTFEPLEQMLAQDSRTGTYCHGDTPGFADVCLYAQIWNNRRFDVPMDAFPTVQRIFNALDALPAFQEAAPPKQPDAQ